MTTELIGIIAASIALGGVMLAALHAVRQEVRDVRSDLSDVRTEIGSVRTEIGTKIGSVRTEIGNLRTELRDEMQAGFKELTARVVNIGDRLSKVGGDHRRDVLGLPQPAARQAASRRGVSPLMACEIPLEIAFDRRAGATTPVKVELDFGRIIDPPHPGRPAPQRRGASGVTRSSSTRGLYYGPRGLGPRGWWTIPAAGGEWRGGGGRRGRRTAGWRRRPCLPMVGVGDEIHYNGDRWQPIAAPGTPRDAADCGLGRRRPGRHPVRQPPRQRTSACRGAGVFFWRQHRQQPRAALRAADAPLRRRGQPGAARVPACTKSRRSGSSSAKTTCAATCSTGSAADARTSSPSASGGGIKVYRNTGTRDGAGLPILEAGRHGPVPVAARCPAATCRSRCATGTAAGAPR